MNKDPIQALAEQQVLSVSALNRAAKHLLEGAFAKVQVLGEISNFTKAASGHWYFTLKDDRAQIRCAMFKGSNSRITKLPQDGDEVTVTARLSLYEPRGDYQLIADKMQYSGVGQLQQAFEQLKKRLAAEGLFDPAIKRPIPRFPTLITVITSAHGAAIEDILTTLDRRYPLARVYLIPVAVQGARAQFEIENALRMAGETDSDVILLARGGGSIEDLWAFNEERVARAIAASEIPIISGVGHETDVTIADYVSDKRAPTPTAAAELATPDGQALSERVESYWQGLMDSMTRIMEEAGERLDRAQEDLISPQSMIDEYIDRCILLAIQLKDGIEEHLNAAGLQLGRASGLLDATSPLATLSRGYAMILNKKGELVPTAKALRKQKTFKIQLQDECVEAMLLEE